MNEVQLANQIINCFDVGKDAAERGFLNKKEDGDNLKNIAIAPLFCPNKNLGEFRIGPFESINRWVYLDGVGYNNIKISGVEQHKIPFFVSQVYPEFNTLMSKRQELPHALFDVIGEKTKMSSVKAVYDSGHGVKEYYFNEYVNIVTPGSIIDPFRRSYVDTLGILKKSVVFRPDELNELAMADCLDSIEYNYILAEDNKESYEFKFNPRRADLLGFQLPITFKKEETGGKDGFTIEEEGEEEEEEEEIGVQPNKYFRGGNPYKNKWISKNMKNDKNENINIFIRWLVLCKELGDTLQIAWLKKIINNRYGEYGPLGLTIANTIAFTCDDPFQVRCTVLGINSIKSVGSIGIFIPGGLNPEEEAAALRSFWANKLEQRFIENNRQIDIIDNLIDDFRRIQPRSRSRSRSRERGRGRDREEERGRGRDRDEERARGRGREREEERERGSRPRSSRAVSARVRNPTNIQWIDKDFNTFSRVYQSIILFLEKLKEEVNTINLEFNVVAQNIIGGWDVEGVTKSKLAINKYSYRSPFLYTYDRFTSNKKWNLSSQRKFTIINGKTFDPKDFNDVLSHGRRYNTILIGGESKYISQNYNNNSSLINNTLQNSKKEKEKTEHNNNKNSILINSTRQNSEKKKYIAEHNNKDIWIANKDQSGYFSFFTISYYSELLMIGYAVYIATNELTMGFSKIQKEAKIFEFKNQEKLHNMMSKPDINNRVYIYPTDPSFLKEMDIYSKKLMELASTVVPDLSFVNDDSRIFISSLYIENKTPPHTKTFNTNFIFQVIQIFQELINYDEQICLFNKRIEKSPIQMFHENLEISPKKSRFSKTQKKLQYKKDSKQRAKNRKTLRRKKYYMNNQNNQSSKFVNI